MEVNSSSVALLMTIGFDIVTDVSITIIKLGFIIMIELPSNPEGGQTHETQLIDKNVIQKMANTIDILTTELDILKQDKNNMKSTYDKEIHYFFGLLQLLQVNVA
jgi:hypothetical protein